MTEYDCQSESPRRLESRASLRSSPVAAVLASSWISDVSDVHTDLQHLEVLGILELEEGGPSGAIQPVVPFDKIEMHIDYPLLDDVDADSTPASAD